MVPKIVVIILNWNGIAVTADCIRSVKHTCYPHFDILLVDNASSDGSFESVKETFPDIQFLQYPENLGYAEGNNRGMKYAFFELAADYIVLLNNDTVVDAGWLQALVEVTLVNREVGAVGSKIFYYNKPETIWCTGGSFGDWRGIPNQIRHNEIDEHQNEEPFQVDYASGCSILITRKAFEQVGYLDKDYFLYFEETDWCARAGRKGFIDMIAPQSWVWHKVGYSSGAVDSPLHTYYMVRNNYFFLLKNTFGLKRSLKLIIYIGIAIRRYVLGRIGKENYWSIFRIVWVGLFDAVRGKSGQISDKIHL